jgi:hypothetical protein
VKKGRPEIGGFTGLPLILGSGSNWLPSWFLLRGLSLALRQLIFFLLAAFLSLVLTSA